MLLWNALRGKRKKTEEERVNPNPNPNPQSQRESQRERKRKGKRSNRSLSIIVPVLDEEKVIERCLLSARKTSEESTSVEIIVVDGGSVDATARKARALGAKVIRATKRGRGTQQDEGTRAARGDFLFFLHADTQLPQGYDSLLYAAVKRVPDTTRMWGAFSQVSISDCCYCSSSCSSSSGGVKKGLLLRLVEFGIKQRTKYLHLPYGDQCLFFHRDSYKESGGYKHVPFMEDYAIVNAQKKKRIKPLLLNGKVTTSGRRWKENGVIPTLLLNQLIIFSWHLGVKPQTLKGMYYKKKY